MQYARSALRVCFAMRRDCVCQVATALRALSLLTAPLRVRLALRGRISRRRARGRACSVLRVCIAMRGVCLHPRDHVRPARSQPATCQALVALHAQLGTTATQAGWRPHRAHAVKGIFL